MKIVAVVEDPKAIRAIPGHFQENGALPQAHYQPAPRGPPAPWRRSRADGQADGKSGVRQNAVRRRFCFVH